MLSSSFVLRRWCHRYVERSQARWPFKMFGCQFVLNGFKNTLMTDGCPFRCLSAGGRSLHKDQVGRMRPMATRHRHLVSPRTPPTSCFTSGCSERCVTRCVTKPTCAIYDHGALPVPLGLSMMNLASPWNIMMLGREHVCLRQVLLRFDGYDELQSAAVVALVLRRSTIDWSL